MPELPDLEVFSVNLTRKLKGKKVKTINVRNSKKLNVSPKQLKQTLEGNVIAAIARDGKELHITFKDKSVLSLHLMLRGKLSWFDDVNDQKFTVIEILFTKPPHLAMSDYQGQATPTLNPDPKPGVDALSKDVNERFLSARLEKSKASIKSVLLDQKFIRGIGNAYADEILYDAGIAPSSVANKIPRDKVKTLAKSIKSVLSGAVKNIRKYDPELITGEVRDFLLVHNHKIKTTPRGEKIIVDASGSRKTYYTREQQVYK